MKNNTTVFFAAGFFVTCIFLVLQLLPVGPTIMAERYTYLPSIGFFFLVGYGIYQWIGKKKSMKIPLYLALAGYGLFLSIATFKRCDVWQDSLTLWNNVLDQFPYVGTALNNRGYIYGKEKGRLDIALEDFNMSIQHEPAYENAYANRGIVYMMQGKADLAMQDFNKALELNPKYIEALVNRGIAYAQTKQVDKAIADFTVVTTLTKDDPSIYVNRGSAYAQSGKYDDAIVDFNTAVSIDPMYPDAYYQRSSALYNKGRYREAYEDVQHASSLGFNVDATYFETIKKAAEKN